MNFKIIVLLVAIVLLLDIVKAYRRTKSISKVNDNSKSLSNSIITNNSKLSMQFNPDLICNNIVTSPTDVNSASFKALAKLISTCGIGVFAAKSGLLDKNVLSMLSKLVFGLLQPCLLFVNVAKTISNLSSEGRIALKILPLAAGIQILIGFLVGKVLSILMYGVKPTDESKQLQTCTTFGNSGPLPLVFADALLKNHVDSSLLPKSVGFISLYLLGWSPLFWIIAPGILSKDNNSNSKDGLKVLIQRIFSPPVIGSLSGLIVGSIPFLNKLLVSSNGVLNPLFEAISTLGAGYLPIVLLVLSGSLIPPPADKSINISIIESNPKTNDQLNFFKQTTLIFLARFLLMPTLGFGLIKIMKKYLPPSISKAFLDPVLVFILLLETCMPSAQNSTVILQLQGNAPGAAKMARSLMAIYVLGVPAMSFWIAKILRETSLL